MLGIELKLPRTQRTLLTTELSPWPLVFLFASLFVDYCELGCCKLWCPSVVDSELLSYGNSHMA